MFLWRIASFLLILQRQSDSSGFAATGRLALAKVPTPLFITNR